jgi:hypothetical protein
MAKQLNDGDRAAVDMLLDQHVSSHDGGIAAASVATATFRQHLQAVEKTLSLLDSWQPAEPAPDLAARTLRRIQEAEALRNGAAQAHHAAEQQARHVM